MVACRNWAGRPIRLVPCQPEALDEQVKTLQQSGYQGWNVTIPHKEAMARQMDHLSPQATRLQAVNTVLVESDGTLTGHNTDWLGFWHDLPTQVQVQVPQQPTVVLGAGGSARAVLAALAWQGATALTLVVRSPQKAQTVVEWFQAEFADVSMSLCTFEDAFGVEKALKRCGLLVNTTPVGLWPQVTDSPLPERAIACLPANCFVYDLIYQPAQTRLTQLAADCQLGTRTGLGMLIRQAMAAFELWTGQATADHWMIGLQQHLDKAMQKIRT